MKATIEGKRYNTDNCEILGKINHYNYSNNYSGTTYLLRASNDEYLIWRDTNGQDLHIDDYLVLWSDELELSIDDFTLSEEQEQRCIELGLIQVVE